MKVMNKVRKFDDKRMKSKKKSFLVDLEGLYFLGESMGNFKLKDQK